MWNNSIFPPSLCPLRCETQKLFAMGVKDPAWWEACVMFIVPDTGMLVSYFPLSQTPFPYPPNSQISQIVSKPPIMLCYLSNNNITLSFVSG